MSRIGSKIRTVREHLGYTQGALADKMQIDRSAVVKWERGTNNIDRANLERFAQLTGASMDWLCDDEASSEHMPLVVRPTSHVAPARAIKSESYGKLMRRFWSAIVPEQLQSRRHDLWSGSIYNPQVDTILKPLCPDIVTERSAIELLSAPRAYYYQVAGKIAQLYAFGQVYNPGLALYVVAYQPDPETCDGEPAVIAHEMLTIHPVAERLARKLGIKYIVVRSESEALETLTQIS